MSSSQSDGQQSSSDDSLAVQTADGTDLCAVQNHYQKKNPGISEQIIRRKSQLQDPDSHVLYGSGTVPQCGPECHDQRAEESGRRGHFEERRAEYLSVQGLKWKILYQLTVPFCCRKMTVFQSLDIKKNITDVVPFTEKIKLELLENIVELKYDKNG